MEMIGRSLLDGMHIEDSIRVTEILSAARAIAKPFFGVVGRYSRPDDTIAIVEISGACIFDEFGSFSAYRGAYRDITPTGLLALESRPAYLDTVYATAPVALCVINRDGRLLAVNERHAILAGRPISNLIGVKVADLHEEGGQNVIRDFRIFDAGGTVPEHELRIRGRTYIVSVTPIRDTVGKTIAISVAHTDATESKLLHERLAQANRHLEELAVRDHLTGLFNRRHFDKTLVDEITRLHDDNSALSVLLIDVDFFKHYNDQYGHMMGDQCLADVAYAIKQSLLRPSDTAFRYGGEEFAAVLSNTDAYGARAVAERIRLNVATLNRSHKASPLGTITVSIGIATAIGPYASTMPSTRDIILETADAALYSAKTNGRNTVIAGAVLKKDANSD